MKKALLAGTSALAFGALCAFVGMGVSPAFADDQPAAADNSQPAAPTSNAMTTPSMSGPLAANPNPASFSAGPLGKVYVTGAITGLAFSQSNTMPGDRSSTGDISNGQIIAQTTEGLVQFYAQAGAYSFPALGTIYTRTSSLDNKTYGLLPVAFVKLAPSDTFSIYAGQLPTLIGGEYAFTYENMNIERGLLWNQENVMARGVQANYTIGPVALNAAVTDGYYSTRYNWLTGAATYTIDTANSVYVQAGGALSKYNRSTFATPVYQNNSEMYVAGYTYNNAPWTIGPYAQYTIVPKNTTIGTKQDGSTWGGALLATYAFDEPAGFSLAGRVEYISSTGSATSGAPNLLYGQGSKAWSATITPTYQIDTYFVRAELSYVGVTSAVPGDAFGTTGNEKSQTRVLLETGVLF